jgi:hypothetical protein
VKTDPASGTLAVAVAVGFEPTDRRRIPRRIPAQSREAWSISDPSGVVNGKKTDIETGFPNKTSADKRLLRLKVEKMDGGLLAVGADKKLVGVWVNEWWASHGKKVAKSTARTEGGRIRTHIVKRIGHLPLSTFGPTQIREWLDQLMEPDDADFDPLGSKSILNIHGYLSMCMDAAVAERLIRVNPCIVSDLPKLERKEPRFLTEGELARVCRVGN